MADSIKEIWNMGLVDSEIRSISGDFATTTALNNLAEVITNFGSYTTANGTGADNHPDVVEPNMKTIYLVKDSSITTGDAYKEWICTNTTTPTYELIGDTRVDLSDYYLKTQTSGAQEIADALDLKQNTLTPGKNISINDYVIDIKNNECSADATSIALGNKSQASGNYSLCYGLAEEGKPNIASGHYCINLGWHSSAVGNYSTVLGGNYCLASGAIDPEDNVPLWGPFAQGVETSSIGKYSHSEGGHTLASGNDSHAEGVSSCAIHNGAHSEGVGTSAAGKGSHSEGFKTLSNFNYAHAEGHSTCALSSQAHSEGQRTSAYGIASHTEGDLTVASGNCSHAEGNATYSIGNRSHSEGSGTSACGVCSHSEGLHTIVSADYSLAIGKYNYINSAIFVIGNGNYDAENDIETRSDVFVADENGVTATKLATSGIADVESAITALQAQLGNIETALSTIINGSNS